MTERTNKPVHISVATAPTVTRLFKNMSERKRETAPQRLERLIAEVVEAKKAHAGIAVLTASNRTNTVAGGGGLVVAERVEPRGEAGRGKPAVIKGT